MGVSGSSQANSISEDEEEGTSGGMARKLRQERRARTNPSEGAARVPLRKYNASDDSPETETQR